MAIVKKISELTPKGSNLGTTDLLIVGVDNGTDYDLKSVTGAQLLGTVVSQTITDGVTTKSPSEDVVYDNLALKVDKVTGSRLITSSEATILGNTSGTNTGDQTLQQVTDKGNVTTTNLVSQSDIYRNILSPSTTVVGLLDLSRYSVLDGDGKIQLKTNAIATGLLKATNITAETTLEFPNKTVGSYTIATTSDLTSKVDSNTAITGATKTKITYDSKGLVTSGADATTSDIADSLNKRYVTDANLSTIGNTSGTNTGDQDLSGYQVMLTSTNLKTLVDTFTTTTTPVDADVVPITDSAGTTTKKLSWSNFKTTLLAYFDTIFPRITAASTGSVISFNVPVVWNTPASPSASNLTDDLTNAKIGYIQKIYHNHTAAPTVPAGWVLMGTGTYTTSTLNVIFAEWVSSTRVEYWITKPA